MLERRASRGGKRWNSNVKYSKDTADLSIYHNNIRGFLSKAESLAAIVKAVEPSIVTLNETNAHGNIKPVIDGYYTYAQNRTDKSMGGISTSVPNSETNNSISLKCGSDDVE